MIATTFLRKRKDMLRRPDPNCHGGLGDLDWTCVLGREQTRGKRLRFIHDDVLAPGVTIGVHSHRSGEEYYYIVSGRGVMTLDGERFEVESGDVAGVFPGGTHGLENNSDEDLRMIAIYVA